MFNDLLNRDECTLLVRSLARCRFPFQCAHGRKSVVAVVGLGGGGGGMKEMEERESMGFVDKWRMWDEDRRRR